MSDNVRIIVTGNDEVAAAMRRLQDESDDLSDPMTAVGQRVVNEAQALSRRKTGALASSVHLEGHRKAASIVSALPYSGVQNYGWRRRNITPSYFMNRAADDKGEVAADLIAAEIGHQIRAAGLN